MCSIKRVGQQICITDYRGCTVHYSLADFFDALLVDGARAWMVISFPVGNSAACYVLRDTCTSEEGGPCVIELTKEDFRSIVRGHIGVGHSATKQLAAA